MILQIKTFVILTPILFSKVKEIFWYIVPESSRQWLIKLLIYLLNSQKNHRICWAGRDWQGSLITKQRPPKAVGQLKSIQLTLANWMFLHYLVRQYRKRVNIKCFLALHIFMLKLKVSSYFNCKIHNLGIYNNRALICLELNFAVNLLRRLKSLQFSRLLSSKHGPIRIWCWSSESTVLKASSNTVTWNVCNF